MFAAYSAAQDGDSPAVVDDAPSNETADTHTVLDEPDCEFLNEQTH